MRHAPHVQALVLCAGLGTRLAPLTDERPKALVPIGDRPLLQHLIERARALGCEKIWVNAHRHAAQLSSYCAGLDPEIHVLHEREILGTAGAVRNASGWLGDQPLVVWNGDILVSPPVSRLIEATQRAEAVLAVAPRSVGTGTVGVDAAGAVVRLRGEVFGEEVAGGDFVGVSAWSAPAARSLPEVGCLVGDGLLPALREGRRVLTLRCPAEWLDIGTLETYLEGNLAWLEERSLAHWCHATAQVSGAIALGQCLVGQGARVDGAGTIERCVVWPGAVARAPLFDSIVTRAGTVSVPVRRGSV